MFYPDRCIVFSDLIRHIQTPINGCRILMVDKPLQAFRPVADGKTVRMQDIMNRSVYVRVFNQGDPQGALALAFVATS